MPYKNPEKNALAKHEYYLRNKESVQIRDKLRLQRNQEFVRLYKQQVDVKCQHCGMGRWECLDFHHVDISNKFMSINELVKRRYSIDIIKREMDKCIILCANCHRIEHAGNVWNEDSNLEDTR